MLNVSSHAIERYRERVKPALDFDPAKLELEALLEIAGPFETEPPEWMRGEQPENDGFIELSDGIVAAIQGGYVATILTRSGASSVYRQRRNENKAAKKRARRGRKALDNLNGSGREPRRRWG